jgi:hypothetical protein
MGNYQPRGNRPEEKCRLCGVTALLCRSHAINDAYFKAIFRTNSGKAHKLGFGSAAPSTTSESGWDFLLCETCEGDLNGRLDRWGHRWFREAQTRIVGHGWRGKFELDPSKMAKYIASVLWRASVSEADAYAGFETTPDIRDQLRAAFAVDAAPFTAMSFGISSLFDGQGFQDANSLRQLIQPPISWVGTNGGREVLALAMCIEGFLVVGTVPRLPHKARQAPNILKPDKPHIYLRQKDIRNTPPFPALFQAAMRQLAE